MFIVAIRELYDSVAASYKSWALSFAPPTPPYDPTPKFSVRARSDYPQTLTVNGAAKTFYTPEPGSNGGRGTGYWRATSTWFFVVDGVPSTVGTDTKTVSKARQNRTTEV